MKGHDNPERCDQCTQLDHTHAIAVAALEMYPMDAVVVVTGQADGDSWTVEAVVVGSSPTDLMRLMAQALRKAAESVERVARNADAERKGKGKGAPS